ncbi:hypothetical protein [Stenotrophomonas maltophilia]|uniref:hypothetical protein n=1 Tax=Stenotrophomonas maltophilia TaxID=40324 RepID=UPI000D40C18E|nr:hypothetical protein [Stenotrophomonas maltophilia]EMB2833275.1 hypothetical protein [Stenotrophomonas maltophilia]MBH1452995.1 hypothetical protein [Stenotrophomonas maltophilia]MBH1568504.1 hypothetical protein [Stenotrophomonas maltophilia]MBH1731134.1 hypothetical protein [Stenotrophomonas maltophilia]MBK5594455.1 hypothetical protein [Stenotrophomonas maltophilia]
MRLFLLAGLAALALAGCQKSTETAITRTTANGVDTLYSKRTVVDGVARFECMASRSGQCHYLLLDPACRPDAACARAPIRSFALAAGTTQEFRDLPKGFAQCVSEDRKEQCHRE